MGTKTVLGISGKSVGYTDTHLIPEYQVPGIKNQRCTLRETVTQRYLELRVGNSIHRGSMRWRRVPTVVLKTSDVLYE